MNLHEMAALTFYATPDATTAFGEMAETWGIYPGTAIVRLTLRGLDVVEMLQEARGWTPPLALLRREIPVADFREATRPLDTPLPAGCKRFPLLLSADLAQRMTRAAQRENAWRLAGRDPSRRGPSVSLHSIMGWSTYEGLVLVEHRLFHATKPHQIAAARARAGGARV